MSVGGGDAESLLAHPPHPRSYHGSRAETIEGGAHD